MVRCGACRTEFDAPGEGRHACPTCGAVNQVGAAPEGAAETAPESAPPPLATPSTEPSPVSPPGPTPAPASPGLEGIPPAPDSDTPASPPPGQVKCEECQFEFFVGDIEIASCPNCGTEVKVP
jgi:hypothetical protein